MESGGAVVVSGRSDAGGGNEVSVSEGGNGANSFEEGGGPSDRWLSEAGFRLFRFAAAAVTEGACSLSSPTFLRSSLIRFFAFSPSVDPGCCRITSL